MFSAIASGTQKRFALLALALSPPLELTAPDLGKAIKFCREIVNLKQWEVADKTEMGASYISRIENGKVNPTLKTVEDLSGALGIDHSKILAVAEVYAEGRRRVS